MRTKYGLSQKDLDELARLLRAGDLKSRWNAGVTLRRLMGGGGFLGVGAIKATLSAELRRRGVRVSNSMLDQCRDVGIWEEKDIDAVVHGGLPLGDAFDLARLDVQAARLEDVAERMIIGKARSELLTAYPGRRAHKEDLTAWRARLKRQVEGVQKQVDRLPPKRREPDLLG
jgi:hypothetical protein